jgi:hypothetical protein
VPVCDVFGTVCDVFVWCCCCGVSQAKTLEMLNGYISHPLLTPQKIDQYITPSDWYTHTHPFLCILSMLLWQSLCRPVCLIGFCVLCAQG